MQQNSLDAISGSSPVLIAEGTNDELVPPSVTNQFVERHRSSGKSVTCDFVKGAGHEPIARSSAAFVISWIGKRFEVKPPPMTKVTSSHDDGNSKRALELTILRFISLIPKLKSSAHPIGEPTQGDYYA